MIDYYEMPNLEPSGIAAIPIIVSLAALLIVLAFLVVLGVIATKKKSRALASVAIGLGFVLCVGVWWNAIDTSLQKRSHLDSVQASAQEHYESQLRSEYGLVNISSETLSQLVRAEGFVSEDRPVGAVLSDSPTTVYWNNEEGELEFTQIVFRIVSDSEVEPVAVSRDDPAPLSEVIAK